MEQGTTLVDKAGGTMPEVVSSIRRVTDIIGEISAASNEQSAGVSQVGEAVTQMDQATQQNAALVEQMAAAASSLKVQAQDLVQVVSTFKLSASDHPGIARPGAPLSKMLGTGSATNSFKTTQKTLAVKGTTTQRAVLPKPTATQASSSSDGEWNSF